MRRESKKRRGREKPLETRKKKLTCKRESSP
jgi:hypothetical protein